MNILVLNSGSSSIKYQLIDPDNSFTLAKGQVERIGMSGAVMTHKPHDRDEVKLTGEIVDHNVAVEYVISILLSKNHGVIKDKSEIHAVGHRYVHGGEEFSESALIGEEELKMLRKTIEFAPLHNPHNLRGINASQHILPGVPQVAVFDTAFHHKMPDYAYVYGLPYVLYKRYGIRRYGFHGTSHYFVSQKAAEMLNKDIASLKMVTCHLGNGCSITAVAGGISIDTSMGFTPLEGLLMGTRCGDIDPAIVYHIASREELTMNEVGNLLNKHSGLLGISGISSDMRELEEEYPDGNQRARLAIHVFTYRLKKYIGSYAAAMGGLDTIVFTGGIGENSSLIRKLSLDSLGFLGVKLDEEKNSAKAQGGRTISAADSRVSVLIVPTNEELVIAQETQRLVAKKNL